MSYDPETDDEPTETDPPGDQASDAERAEWLARHRAADPHCTCNDCIAWASEADQAETDQADATRGSADPPSNDIRAICPLCNQERPNHQPICYDCATSTERINEAIGLGILPGMYNPVIALRDQARDETALRRALKSISDRPRVQHEFINEPTGYAIDETDRALDDQAGASGRDPDLFGVAIAAMLEAMDTPIDVPISKTISVRAKARELSDLGPVIDAMNEAIDAMRATDAALARVQVALDQAIAEIKKATP